MPSVCIGVVYLWFGMLKFFPGISPAETIAIDTITELTLGVVSPHTINTTACHLGNRNRVITDFWTNQSVSLEPCHCTYGTNIYPICVFSGTYIYKGTFWPYIAGAVYYKEYRISGISFVFTIQRHGRKQNAMG